MRERKEIEKDINLWEGSYNGGTKFIAEILLDIRDALTSKQHE